MFDKLIDYLADMNLLCLLLLTAGFVVAGYFLVWYIVALALWLASHT